MFNFLLNKFFDLMTSFALRKYKVYPAATTAVVYVNLQRAFVANQPELMENLKRLHALAQKKGFQIVHAPYRATTQKQYPVPGEVQLMQKLAAMPDGVTIPSEFAPREGDMVLAERSTLSAFAQSDLHQQLQGAGLEHLIIVGPCANLTLDSTIRDGVQFGYHVSLLCDCAAAASAEETRATVRVTLPRYAQSVMDLEEFESLV